MKIFWCIANILFGLSLITSQVSIPLAVDTIQVVTSSGDSGPGTLRQALFSAVSGDTITFAKDGFSATDAYVNGEKVNFADYINSFRVQEAIHLFENDTNNRTILNISLDAGFNAKSTFNLVFKKHTGVSPREYIKNMMRNKAALPSV